MEPSRETKPRPHVAADTDADLRRRWDDLGDDLGVPGGGPAAARWAEAGVGLLAAYGAPGRAYHGVGHLEAVLVVLDELWPHPDRPVPAPVRAAAWFHDAVYDPTRADNEARSAAWARRALGSAGVEPAAGPVSRLVEATAAHRLVGDLVATPGAACFLDADLAVLGAGPRTYDHYAAAIRAEYGHLDDAAFRAGRLAVLEGLAARPHLFLSGRGRTRFDASARANLAGEIASLADK